MGSVLRPDGATGIRFRANAHIVANGSRAGVVLYGGVFGISASIAGDDFVAQPPKVRAPTGRRGGLGIIVALASRRRCCGSRADDGDVDSASSSPRWPIVGTAIQNHQPR